MQQPQDSSPLARMERQLDRLEERTRDIVTRSDLETLRKELVGREVLESQLTVLKAQIANLENEVDKLKEEQTSRADRLWMKIGPIIGCVAVLISILQFLQHVRFTP